MKVTIFCDMREKIFIRWGKQEFLYDLLSFKND